MEYIIKPSRINEVEKTESDLQWDKIVAKSKCKDCIYFRKCKHKTKNGKACQDFDQIEENFSIYF